MDAAQGGSARIIEVVGEPGIGKTRLLGELSARAEERGHLVLSGRAAEFERDLPFGVLLDALDDYVGSLQPRFFEAIKEDQLRELATIFPSLSDVAAGASEGLLTERYRAHRAVRVLLERLAARRPLVLALDDLHWADDAAVELVSHLLRRRPTGRVLVLLAMRSGQAPTRLGVALEEGAREGAVERVELTALTREQAEAFVGGGADRGMVDALYQASGGNPFYLEQLTRSAGPEGLRAGHVNGGAAEAGVPSAVAAALARELERLSPLARTVAQAAAVVGEPFEPDLVADTAAVTEGEVSSVVDELLDSALIARTDVPRRFRFRHPIVRHAVYESAGVGWRTESHRRAAASLAARGARPAVRAPHIERSACSGDETAIATLTAAGQAAATRAPASAARWFEAALRLLPDEANPDERIGLLLSLAISLAATGRFEESLAAVEEALRLLPPELPAMRVQLIAARAGIEHLLGRYDAAHARLEAALVDSASVGWGEQAVLKLELAGNRLFASDFEAALRWAGEALEAARTHDDTAVAAAAAAQLSFAECSLGRMDRADAFRGDAVALLQRLDDTGGTVRLDALVLLGWSEYFLERFEDARKRFERATATARATGQMYMFVPSTLGLAYAHATLGNLGQAGELADQAVEAARLGADRRGLSWALFEHCWIAVLAGDLETAIRCGEESVKIARSLDESFFSAGAGVPLAAAVLERGDPDRCIELILTSIGGEELPWVMRGIRCLCYELLTLSELARENLDQAAHWANRAEHAAHDLPPGMATGRARRARAHVLLSSGSAAAAAREALAAAADADGVGARVEAARSRTLAGRALAAAGEAGRAAGQLEAAEAELAVLEARRYRDETARELRLLGHTARRPARGRRDGKPGEGVPSLSARELEVAQLVSEGKTNRQIAGEIFLSEKTVESHLSHIFTKLGVRSRSAVAAEVAREDTEAAAEPQ